ncbi:MAG: hypothetical protein ILP09_07200 [Oscillospiraceae bacterium]|nr:hypothetical protein [Oscillospiraceae bacterium]
MDHKPAPTGWIWSREWNRDCDGEPRIVRFRREFELKEAPLSFFADVSADSRYKLYVNGAPVSVGPCKGDGMIWYYETVDLAGYLMPGKNVIAAEVLRYPVIGMYNHSVWRTQTPGFYLKGEAAYTDRREGFFADAEWRCLIDETTSFRTENQWFDPLYINERAAGDRRLQGWKKAGYDDRAWPAARGLGDFGDSNAVSPGNLHKRPIPMMYEKERRFKSVAAVRSPEGGGAEDWERLISAGSLTVPAGAVRAAELDAGELTTGYLMLSFKGGSGAKVRIECAESYVFSVENKEHHFFMHVKGDRTDHVNGVLSGYADDYALSGHGEEGAEEYYEPFWFRTFRFVRLEITAGDEPVTITDLKYRETGYPLQAKTIAEASDPDFGAIWDISLRTLRRCMHETYEDCPFYEQLQYAMDTRSQILYTYAVAADDRMARRTIDDFRRSQRPDGLINCSYPCYGPNVIPGFSLYYILMIHDHMMYFGDREMVKRCLPAVDGILGFFDRNIGENGIVRRIGESSGKYWSFIDWVPQWGRGMPNADGDGPVTMESFLYLCALQHAAELSAFCGRNDTAEEYLERAEKLKKALRSCCIGEKGLYTDAPGRELYSQHCQAFAVLTGTADESEYAELMEKALDGEGFAKCTVAFSFYLFRALEKAGMYERTRELWAPWREMVKNHLSTCMESNDNPRSDCHAWGALLLYELPSVILGVRPARPGYAAVKVAPTPGYLERAEGSVCTPAGMIDVSWKRGEDGRPVLDIKAPDGVEIIRESR